MKFFCCVVISISLFVIAVLLSALNFGDDAFYYFFGFVCGYIIVILFNWALQ